MIDLNKVVLMGNATRDLELRFTAQGTAFGNGGMAINRIWASADDEKHEETCFVDIKFWGPITEQAESIFRKGSKVFVEGHLRGESWDDRQTGEKRSRLVVVAERVGNTD